MDINLMSSYFMYCLQYTVYCIHNKNALIGQWAHKLKRNEHRPLQTVFKPDMCLSHPQVKIIDNQFEFMKMAKVLSQLSSFLRV